MAMIVRMFLLFFTSFVANTQLELMPLQLANKTLKLHPLQLELDSEKKDGAGSATQDIVDFARNIVPTGSSTLYKEKYQGHGFKELTDYNTNNDYWMSYDNQVQDEWLQIDLAAWRTVKYMEIVVPNWSFMFKRLGVSAYVRQKFTYTIPTTTETYEQWENEWRTFDTHEFDCDDVKKASTVGGKEGDYTVTVQGWEFDTAYVKISMHEHCDPVWSFAIRSWKIMGTTNLWGQCGGSNRKCGTEPNAINVGDRLACERIAKSANHPYYQYYETKGICHSVASCNSPRTGTVWDWRIFGKTC